MLKIKDNIKLKDLKKFNFRKVTKEDGYADFAKYVCEFCSNEYICIYKSNEINIHTNGWKMKAQEMLFDLIEAELVEKVVEK